MIYRNVFNEIKQELDNNLILLLTGARQVGKTTLLKQLQNSLKENTDTYFLNLEDPQIKSLLNEHPNKLFEITGSNKDEEQFIFIDEIQYLDDPTNFLKYIYDEYSKNIKLIVSGSSSFYIDQKFKDSLIGRKKVFNINTLDFFEFLEFKGKTDIKQKILKNNSVPLLYKDELNNLFLEYITYGGYPEIVMISDKDKKIERLNDYAFDYVKKDIFDASIQDQDKFFQLLRILASQTGELVNTNELANTIGLTYPTVDKYLYIMQKSFHISLLKPFFTNVRKELTKMPKVYFHDLGMRNVLLKNFENIKGRLDKGAFLENIVFREIMLKQKLSDSIKFWRTQNKNEVDFIINESLAYEIKFSKSQIKLSKYKTFKEKYPNIPLEFITFEDIFDKIIFN